MLFLLGEHILAALLQFFYFIAYVSCDLAGFGTGLRHGFLHGSDGLIAQFYSVISCVSSSAVIP